MAAMVLTTLVMVLVMIVFTAAMVMMGWAVAALVTVEMTSSAVMLVMIG
jgi:hypothetical protein